MGIAALVGSPVKRREDPRLITGQATYVDDIKLTGMLHMAVLRSPYGHARIDGIDTGPRASIPALSRCTPRKISRALSEAFRSLCQSGILPKAWVCAVH